MAKFNPPELAGVANTQGRITECLVLKGPFSANELPPGVNARFYEYPPPYYRVQIFNHPSGHPDGCWWVAEVWLRKKIPAPDLVVEKETSLV